MTFLSYFTDAVLRGPTIGSMLMCLTAALIGTLTFLRRQSLVGEALSHSAYPGVIVGIILTAILLGTTEDETGMTFLIICGAFTTALMGLWTIHWLEKRYHIKSDSALCFVLAAFFGIGITLASDVQFSYSSLYRQAQTYLYGQAATMTDTHIAIYGTLSVIIIAVVFLLDKELQAIIFNQDYAYSIGIKVNMINSTIFILTTLAIVIGIRSVGVVLMSAMLIAPAVAARQFTNCFRTMLCLAGIFGMMSGYLGNFLSVELTRYLAGYYPESRIALPTGPMIVLAATGICIIALLIAPERGLLLRFVRATRFKYRCISENILKAIWLNGSMVPVSFEQISQFQGISRLYLHFILQRLIAKKWLETTDVTHYQLTPLGLQKAARIVRLHRLWEVYLADYLGVGAERVHRNAEEMEHILTPELEQELTLLLKDPQVDPHQQLIPPKDHPI